MIQDRATCEADHRRFIERVIENEVVWYLENDSGVANSVTNDEDEMTVLIFWSDRAYAQRVQKESFDDYAVASMDLFSFLYRWLPGMSGDGVIAGTNWSASLIGLETDAFELREQIEAEMPKSLLDGYEDQYEQLTQ